MSTSHTDQKSCAHANRLLVICGEATVVHWFEIPAEAMLATRPEHEISSHLTGC